MDEYIRHEIGQIIRFRHLSQLIHFVMTVKNWPEVLLIRLGIKRYGTIQLRNGLRFLAYPSFFNAVDMFYNQPYRKLEVKERVVVDIGGFVGDSSIYFAHRGAKQVIAYEPDRARCDAFEQNMKLNNITNVLLHRRGLKSLTEIEVHDAALKIDCEGCEYELLLNSECNVLSNYNQIIMEYHDGHESIEASLINADFIVEIICRYDERTGILYATKKP